jgi:phosphoribosylformylglycinamidine synthase
MSESEAWRAEATLEQALEHGLKKDEFERVTELLGRPLNMVELGVCSALYSEHCSYKSTKVHLKTLPTTGDKVLVGPGENAGAIDIGDNQAVVFKIESHNHPSFIEPFQGAATGVGGILRDVFTMGARPLANMNSIRFGKKENPRTKHLLKGAVSGIGSYGNCMGIPTVGGEVVFHEAYDGNCLVNAFALGLAEHDGIFLGNASGIGNGIFYVGSKTGRDGIHGATMASDVFDEDSEQKRPTVQVGDPFQEKLLLESCLEAMATGAVVGIQDMGAAGLTSSAYEMAERAGTGVVLHLDRVPQRESHMNPYELMLSESQERMVLVVEKGREEEILEIYKHWGLDAVQIGEVVEGENVDLYWNGDCISSIPVTLLTSSVPEYRWPEKEPENPRSAIEIVAEDLTAPGNLGDTAVAFMSSINMCSRQAVYDQYDSTVRSNTVVHPGGDAAVIRVKPDSTYNLGSRVAPKQMSLQAEKKEKGVAMTLDCNARFCEIDPRLGAALSVAEAVRNVTAVGASPIGISDCLNFGSPERPEGMFQIAQGIRGLGDAARAFNVPIVSGNASLYNESVDSRILPTPTVALVGLIEDASLSCTAHFKSEGDVVLLIGDTNESDLGGSEYLAWKYGIEHGTLPVLDYDLELKTAEVVRDLIAQQQLASCHDVSVGGLAAAFIESCFNPAGSLGAILKIEQEISRPDLFAFAETGARYIVSCSADSEAGVRAAFEEKGIPVRGCGTVGGASIEVEGVFSIALEDVHSGWRSGLSEMFS